MYTITNLTHIGFHRSETPEFDATLGTYIESVANDASHILNFVNIRNDERADMIRRQDLIFFEKLRYLLTAFHSQALPGTKDIPIEIGLSRLGIPQILAQWLLENYREDIEIIRGDKIRSFGNMQTGPTDEEKESDDHYARFRSEKFLEVIERMIAEFSGTNLFHLQLFERIDSLNTLFEIQKDIEKSMKEL